MGHSIIEDFEHLYLDDFFLDVEYSSELEFIESSRGIEAVFFEGRYYNKKRENKRDKSKVFTWIEYIPSLKNGGAMGLLNHHQSYFIMI